jgi:hypothetical protein
VAVVELAVISTPRFPEMRHEVISALTSLSDPWHQAHRWGRYEDGVSYYDDLTMNVNILFDDCQVLPDPASSVGDILFEGEVFAFLALSAALGPMIDDLGNRSDQDYIGDSRWGTVVGAASKALLAMRSSDAGDSCS